jgi:hypothetical protein
MNNKRKLEKKKEYIFPINECARDPEKVRLNHSPKCPSCGRTQGTVPD